MKIVKRVEKIKSIRYELQVKDTKGLDEERINDLIDDYLWDENVVEFPWSINEQIDIEFETDDGEIDYLEVIIKGKWETEDIEIKEG